MKANSTILIGDVSPGIRLRNRRSPPAFALGLVSCGFWECASKNASTLLLPSGGFGVQPFFVHQRFTRLFERHLGIPVGHFFPHLLQQPLGRPNSVRFR